MRFLQKFVRIFLVVEKFHENISFPESFRENMCKTRANAGGSMKRLLYAKN
jgi:hypothetical protein